MVFLTDPERQIENQAAGTNIDDPGQEERNREARNARNDERPHNPRRQAKWLERDFYYLQYDPRAYGVDCDDAQYASATNLRRQQLEKPWYFDGYAPFFRLQCRDLTP